MGRPLPQAKKPYSVPVVSEGDYLSYREILIRFEEALCLLSDVLYYQAVGNSRARQRSTHEAQDLLRAIAASIEPDPLVPASETLPRLLQFIVFTLEGTLRSGKMSAVHEAMAMLEPIRETFITLEGE